MLTLSPQDLLETRIRTSPAAEATTRNAAAECDPREAGLAPADVDAIWGSVVALYETGLHPAAALCLRRGGKVVIDRAIGHASGNGPDDAPGTPRVAATPETLFNLFSASKSVTAMVVHLLDERNLLHLDDPVDEYIPGFGRHGKEWVTLRHVLSHRAGIPSLPPGVKLDLDLLADPARIVDAIADAPPTWRPGRRLAYHALTGGWVLGEVVRRIAGVDIRTFLGREVLAPLGFKHMNYGVPLDEVGQVARHAFTGPPLVFPLTWIIKRALGIPFVEGVRLSNDPRFLTAIVPAGNVVGTANEACRFYELLLRGGTLDGVRIFDRRTIRRATVETSWLEMDLVMIAPVRYGMGFVLGGDHASLYGPATPRAFGHLGFTNLLVWADPERDISVALMTSGKPFFAPLGIWRFHDVARRISARCPRTPFSG